ncbi:hypothetical protein DACRYDRAFT_14748 [Dacryopinax primogenitus]|uniref:C2H2-type domain-containing protein n=1 Tax=Dacryopinax primogenitus (strain DJM 731) TaxID=1858805 RepID=M5G683_DACPD|nr:uncharacterized protein DACRYDRAFT_14748 [Dacryopinax primogenitus]EJU03710.1 hypothetical protein DACRYDRAFT_14748 [Dacryopinax primogenitus]
MPKRPSSPSPSPPPKIRRSQRPEPSTSTGTGTSAALTCTLPPTCHRHPAVLEDAQALERHYRTYHTHVCQERKCLAVFPDDRLLELHFAECHDPIFAIRKERGEKTFACFIPTCPRTFLIPAKRRLHLIDAHHYPKEYFFAITNKGIGGLLQKWGEGVSLVRPEWKPRLPQMDGVEGQELAGIELEPPPTPITSTLSHGGAPNDTSLQQSKNGLGLSFLSADSNARESTMTNSGAGATGDSQPLGWSFPQPRSPPLQHTLKPSGPASSGRKPLIQKSVSDNTPSKMDSSMDDLTSVLSSVSLVPRTIRFGRGGAKAGFQRPPGWKKANAGTHDPGESTMPVDSGA